MAFDRIKFVLRIIGYTFAVISTYFCFVFTARDVVDIITDREVHGFGPLAGLIVQCGIQ